MWGFIIALVSGALMSIQGVFNTGSDKADEYLGVIGMGAVQCIYCLCNHVVFYRPE